MNTFSDNDMWGIHNWINQFDFEAQNTYITVSSTTTAPAQIAECFMSKSLTPNNISYINITHGKYSEAAESKNTLWIFFAEDVESACLLAASIWLLETAES